MSSTLEKNKSVSCPLQKKEEKHKNTQNETKPRVSLHIHIPTESELIKTYNVPDAPTARQILYEW